MIDRDIAIIGIAGYFPEADSVYSFKNNLVKARDSIRPVDLTRKQIVGQQAEDFGAFALIEDIHFFDHKFFGLSLAEAKLMDPHQRLALQVAYHTFENAAIHPDLLKGSNISVFSNHAWLEYHRLSTSDDPMLLTGNMSAAITARISRFFDLRGKSLTVDTTCSSALTAVHLAVNDLVAGDSDAALVIGVNLNLIPWKFFRTYSLLGINAANGKTKAFAEDADGTGWGEVVCGVLLKPLKKAVRDGDIIHGVIKGSYANQDAGLSSSLTASSSTAQCEVLKRAWSIGNIAPETIGYIEAHGTGTKLGDPIEIEGMDLAFRTSTNKKHFCAVSSVKSNIGHTNNAAGLVGLIKAVLAVKYKWLFPSLHSERLNPLIDFKNSAVYVNRESKPWVCDHGKRIAGVSSFGLSGTNCHVVIEESHVTERSESQGNYLITSSALTRDSLDRYLQKLLEFVRADEVASIGDLSFTLNCYRKNFTHRFAVMASSLRQLEDIISFQSEENFSSFLPAKTVFVFSNTLLQDEQLTSAFAKRFPVFEKALLEIHTVANAEVNGYFYTFTFQYCFYKLLQYLGISSNNFLYEGVGEITFKAISGSLSLSEAVAKVQSYQHHRAAKLEERIRVLVAKEAQAGNVLFLECGPGGSLCDILESMIIPEVKVFKVRHNGDHSVEQVLSDLYLSGENPNFELVFDYKKKKRIELPPYQFEKKICWLDHITIPAKQSEPTAVLHRFSWVNLDDSNFTGRSEDLHGNVLLFIDDGAKGMVIAESIRGTQPGLNVIVVQSGNRYYKKSDKYFFIDFKNAGHYEDLYQNLTDSNTALTCIISARDLFEPEHGDGFCNDLFLLTKTFHRLFSKKDFQFIYLTSGAVRVHENDNVNAYLYAKVSYVKSLRSDFPASKVHSIDFEEQSDLTATAQLCVHELTRNYPIKFAAYRNNKRHIQNLESYTEPRTPVFRLHPGAAYIITGGASGVGFEVASYIASRQPLSSLIILGRRNERNPAITASLNSLRTKCKNVIYKSVDVSDRVQMTRAFQDIYVDFQKIDGVFHCAGVLGKQVPLKDRDTNEFQDTLKPKVAGTMLLLEAVKRMHPEFCLLFSSLNSIIPRKHSHGYCTANAFQDAVAIGPNQYGLNIISLNLPGWQNIGFDLKVEEEPVNAGYKFLSASEGIDLMLSCVLYSTKHLIAVKGDIRKFATNPFFALHAPGELSTPQMVHEDLSTSSIQEAIVAIWKEVLKSDTINFKDDFFELGGHSLNATQLLLKIKKQFDVDIEFDDLFEYPTVESLSSTIEKRMNAAGRSLVPSASIKHEEPSSKAYDTTSAQKSIWFLEKESGDYPLYAEPRLFKITGKLDIGRLESAFYSLLERHEILRTTFHFHENNLIQKIHGVKEVPKAFHFHRNPVDEIEFTNQLLNEKFDLENGPLIKIILWKTNEGFNLFMTTHHLISDGWSMNVFFKELIQIYSHSDSPELPVTTQYKDYVQWFAQNDLSSQKNYWAGVFSRPLLYRAIPADSQQAQAFVGFAGTVNLLIHNEVLGKVSALTNRLKVSHFTFLLSVINIWLYRITGNTDIVIGCPVSGRVHPDLMSAVGLYVNTLPIRTGIDNKLTVSESISRINVTVTEALKNQAYPFASIVNDLRIQREMGRNPLFDVGFTWHGNEFVDELAVADELLIRKHQLDPTYALNVLWFHGFEGKSGVQLQLVYSQNYFSSDTTMKMRDSFEETLNTILNNPAAYIIDVAHSTSVDKRQVDFDFNYALNDE